MPTSTKVKNLNINELTEAQYDAAVQGGVIGANELSVLTDVEYVEPSDLATVATTGDYSDLINRPTNLVSTNTSQTISGPKTFSGDITLSGTTSIKNNTGGTNYTMMYRDASTIHVGASTSTLKLEGGGTRPAYNNDSLALLSDVTGGLPSQTGNAGKFLTTDGTDASWGTTISEPLSVINTGNAYTASLTIGNGANSDRYFKIVPSWTGTDVSLYFGAVLVGDFMPTGFVPSGNVSFSIGASHSKLSYVYTEKINNGGDITVPAVAGKMAVQVSSMPTAASTNEGEIYQYIGTTDSTYTNGHFYKCVSDGAVSPTYSWTAVEVQASSGLQNTATGTGSLTILGTAATSMYTINIGDSTNGNQINSVIIGHSATSTGGESVAVGRNANTQYDAVAFGFNARATIYGVAIGNKSKAQGESMAVGRQAEATGSSSTAVGNGAKATAERAIQIGPYATNSEAGTLCVATKFNNTTVNYKLMDADGTIPTARLTKVNSTITLTAAGWSSNSQTVNVTGMTATGVVMVSPDPTDQSAYTSAGILCTAQAAGTLTFSCDTVPSGDLSVNVVML